MTLEERVIKVIRENTEENAEITLNKKWAELDMDSLDFLMIVHGLEDEFNITIEEDDLKNIVTVNDVIDKLRTIVQVDRL